MSALGQKQTCALQKAMSALPPIATAKAEFPQKSCLLYLRKRTCAVHQECLLWAKSGHRTTFYSITSSARASRGGGTVRPSVLAVLRLIISSYFVGACTGRSAGFSPFR